MLHGEDRTARAGEKEKKFILNIFLSEIYYTEMYNVMYYTVHTTLFFRKMHFAICTGWQLGGDIALHGEDRTARAGRKKLKFIILIIL